MALREELVTAARLDPGARRRAELNDQMSHDFTYGVSMWDILAEAKRLGPIDVSTLSPPQYRELRLIRAA